MSTSVLPIEIDHVYIFVTEHAPEAAILQSSGLRLDEQETSHSGQGTSSRCFLFKNTYLELFWVRDMQEMTRYVEETGLDLLEAERQWKETGASPFGIGFHYVDGDSNLPVSTKRYQSPWMPPASWIDIVPKTSVYEPEYFVVSDGIAYIDLPESFPDAEHALGIERLTQVCITVTDSSKIGPMSQLLMEHGILQIQEGPTPLMELTFDRGKCGKLVECRPTLPLILHY